VIGPIRAVILEDEPLAASRLEAALRQTGGVEVVGSAADGRRGLELIRANEVDVAFLDIRMPGLDGLEVARRLGYTAAPAVVFVTAYDQFAIEAFRLAAVDYLLKPVEFDRVAEAVARVRQRLDQSTAEERAARLQTLLATLRDERGPEEGEGPLRFLWVADARGRLRVDIDAVEWFEAERDYVRLHTPGRAHLMRGTLQGLAERLDPLVFLRVHRSAVVNLRAVTGLRRRLSGSTAIELRSGGEAPVGRAYLRDLKARIGLPARGGGADDD